MNIHECFLIPLATSFSFPLAMLQVVLHTQHLGGGLQLPTRSESESDRNERGHTIANQGRSGMKDPNSGEIS
jgi:hypothetical protein